MVSWIVLRLTLRSGRDGRFLARIIYRDGFSFLLDYGDPRVIQDAAQRVLKGFTMWRSGKLIVVEPHDPHMLAALADLYAHEGMLVAYEEPAWHLPRDATLTTHIASFEELLDDEDFDLDRPTQTVSPEDFMRLVGDLQPLLRERSPPRTMPEPTPAPAERLYHRRRLDALLGARQPHHGDRMIPTEPDDPAGRTD